MRGRPSPDDPSFPLRGAGYCTTNVPNIVVGCTSHRKK